MRLSENRAIAWIILAVCVIISVVGMGGSSYARQRERIVDIYLEGAEDRDANHCMDAYLKRMLENARLMALEVQLHIGENHEEAAEIIELISDYDSEADDGFFTIGRIYKQLREQADYLYNDMYAAELTDAQRRDFKLAYDDFQGAVKMIEKDPYDQMAESFNDDINSSILADAVAGILGIDELCDVFY